MSFLDAECTQGAHLHQALSLKEEIVVKNKRLFALLLAMVMMLSTSMPLMASPGRIPQNNEPVHTALDYTVVYMDGARYYFGQVIVEVFYTDSGEIVSREYFDVYIPEAELNSHYANIMPMTTLPRRTVWLPNVHYQHIGSVSTGLGNHTSTIHMHHEGSTLLNPMGVGFVAVSNTLHRNIGGGTLGPGRSANIYVPFSTLSFSIGAVAREPGGGWATLSVT